MKLNGILCFFAGQMLLRAAIANIRLMQWLYNNRLIRSEGTEAFFRFSKMLEPRADALSIRNTQ